MIFLKLKIAILGVFCLFSVDVYSQSTNPDLSPKWEKYYEAHPSGIREDFQASDFIQVVKKVKYLPLRKEISGDFDLFETLMLSLPQSVLRQMSIDGWYYSMTYKHDDYFLLYNKYYSPISKEEWDSYCPYLIPLMAHIDNKITLY